VFTLRNNPEERISQVNTVTERHWPWDSGCSGSIQNRADVF